MALEAMERIQTLIHDPSLNKFCDVHLRLNELHFESYMLTNGKLEEQDTRADNTDFYMVAKARAQSLWRAHLLHNCAYRLPTRAHVR